MKQVLMTAYGPAEVLQLVEAEIPTPKKGEVLVKVSAIGVNYSDVLRRKNTYFMPTPLPYVPGAEAVGIVQEAVDVDNPMLSKGSTVLAVVPMGGAYAGYVVAPQQYCVPLPPSIDPQIATAIFVQGSTAHLLVHQVAKGLKGKTVLIHAATGGVGSLLVQLAKMEGARVIAASSSDEKLLKAKELGADMVINYSRPNWVKQLVELNEGAKVDYIFEMVGGKIYEQSFSALKTGGTMVVYGAASGEKGLVHSEHFVDESHQLLSFNLAHFIQVSPGEWQASLGAVIGLLAQGQLKVDTSAVYPLHRASDAHKDLEGRKTTGKVVLVP